MPEEQINLLVIRPITIGWGPLPDKYLQQLMAVDSRIKAQDASTLADEEIKGDTKAAKQLGALLAQADILWANRPPKNLVARSPRLKWVHAAMTGVDSWGVADFVKSLIVLTNSSGMHSAQVAETALLHMMMLAKNATRLVQQKQNKLWQSFVPIVLEHKTVAVLGLGPIGKNVARLCKAYRMKVLGVRARADIHSRYTDEVYPPEKMREIFPRCDFVVNVLPFNKSTEKIVGEAELRAMKPTAFFVNVGRGSTVDQDALIQVLSENRIAGAGLDVFTPDLQPLPPDSKFWTLPNVTITPTVGGRRDDYVVLATNLFVKNLKRYLAGKRLFNKIDKETLPVKSE